jgi:hypothetical protein
MPRNSKIGEVDAEVCSPTTIARLLCFTTFFVNVALVAVSPTLSVDVGARAEKSIIPKCGTYLSVTDAALCRPACQKDALATCGEPPRRRQGLKAAISRTIQRWENAAHINI